MRVYTGDAAAMTLDPPRVPTSPDRVLDRTYLEDAWNVDILSAEGFVKMKQIVNFIKTTPLNNNACTHPQLPLFADWLMGPQDKTVLLSFIHFGGTIFFVFPAWPHSWRSLLLYHVFVSSRFHSYAHSLSKCMTIMVQSPPL